MWHGLLGSDALRYWLRSKKNVYRLPSVLRFALKEGRHTHGGEGTAEKETAVQETCRDDCAARPMRAPILVVGWICAIFVTAMMVATPSATFEARHLADGAAAGSTGLWFRVVIGAGGAGFVRLLPGAGGARAAQTS